MTLVLSWSWGQNVQTYPLASTHSLVCYVCLAICIVLFSTIHTLWSHCYSLFWILFSLFFFTLCLSVSSSNSIIHYMVCVLFSDHFTSSDFLFSALPPSIRGHTHTQCSSGVYEWGGSKNRTGLLTHDRLMRQGGEEGRWMERGVYVGVCKCQRGNTECACANKEVKDK